jgi:hypothetical protein
MNYRTPEQNKKTKYVWAWPAELVTICNAEGKGPYPKFKDWVSDKSKNTWYMEKDYSYSTVSDLHWEYDMTQDEISKHPYNAGGNGGNNNYDDDNGVYRIKVDETCRFTFQNNGVTYALAYDESQSANGSLVMKVLNNDDPNQIWRLETTIQNDTNYGYLYNYGAEKRIEVSSPQYKAAWTDNEDPHAQHGRFKLVKEGNGYYIYLRYYEVSNSNKYLGSDAINNGASIWMDKTVANGQAILWTKSAASAPEGNNNSNNNNGSSTPTGGNLSEEKHDSYTLDVSKNADGSFNISYNNQVVKSNATSFKIKWSGNSIKYNENSDPVIPALVVQQGGASATTEATETGSYDVSIATFNPNDSNPSSFGVRSNNGVPFYLSIE